MKLYKKIYILTFCITVSYTTLAQSQNTVDGIVAIVGKEIILYSDIQKTALDYKVQTRDNNLSNEEINCLVLRQLLLQKLFVHQADLDSIVLTTQQIDNEMNSRLNYILQQAGGNQKLIEEYYGKTMEQIKADLREILYDQMLTQQVQSSITQKLTITPTEVKKFFEKADYDDLPLMSASYEFGHIVKSPPINNDEIQAIKDRLNEYRERVLRGEKLSMLARLYSDDPGSASKGGNLGFVERGNLYPEFEMAAFKLRTGEISPVIKTRAGYHIIQLIERKGESINIAHILLQPKPSVDEQVKAIEYLDSVKKIILTEKPDFSAAALKYSDDPNKNSGGWIINPYSLSTKFEKENIEPSLLTTLDKLIPGEYSDPLAYIDEDGVMRYRIIYLKSKTPAHKPNLVEDYDMIQNAALEQKKSDEIDKWIVNKVKITSIKISNLYKSCNFISEWQIP